MSKNHFFCSFHLCLLFKLFQEQKKTARNNFVSRISSRHITSVANNESKSMATTEQIPISSICFYTFYSLPYASCLMPGTLFFLLRKTKTKRKVEAKNCRTILNQRISKSVNIEHPTSYQSALADEKEDKQQQRQQQKQTKRNKALHLMNHNGASSNSNTHRLDFVVVAFFPSSDFFFVQMLIIYAFLSCLCSARAV